MKNVAVLTDKWCDLNQSLGVTSGYYNLVGSLECSGLAEHIHVFYYDEYYQTNNNNTIDNHLLNFIENNSIDLLIVNYHPVENHPQNIKTETINKIHTKVPIVLDRK